jgi:uncharacterized protein YbbC (DUF1343 family)
MRSFINLLLFIVITNNLVGQVNFSHSIIVGAEQMELYLPLLKHKNIAVVGNQSSLVENTHLVDTLLSSGISVKIVLSPEHGFRGVADAGELIDNSRDQQTGLPIVSLYGNHKKPTPGDLEAIDYVLFDIQDVGVRFYTYISTLHYVMEACAENHIPLMILDRPNPNGFYVDGPVLDTALRSFVGMHPVPLLHGMTIAEYALMINGEHWLAHGVECQLQVVPCINYTHQKLYQLPIKPSPNLPNMRAIWLYPSLALFEGTEVSVGRGTDFPFQAYGHPNLKKTTFQFTPVSKPGAKNPKLENMVCKGFDLRFIPESELVNGTPFTLQYLIASYSDLKKKGVFFNAFFAKLAGTYELQKQIELGMDETAIRKTWENDLETFKAIRHNYLLYTDFE